MFLWKVRLSVRKLCSVGFEEREQEALVLPDIRVENRKLCSGGYQPREQEALFLPDVRVDSGGSCVLKDVRLGSRNQELRSVGIEARKQEALFLQDVRVESRRELYSVGGEARKQESGAVLLWKVRLSVRKLCTWRLPGFAAIYWSHFRSPGPILASGNRPLYTLQKFYSHEFGTRK